MNIGGVADAGFNRAVDVANETGGLANGSDLHGAVKPAGLGGIDRDDLRGTLFDDLDHVVSIPCRFIRHHRHIDGTRDLGETLDPRHRLLDIFQPIPFHGPNGLYRFARGTPAFIGVDADVDLVAGGLTHRRNHGDVALRIDPDFNLD